MLPHFRRDLYHLAIAPQQGSSIDRQTPTQRISEIAGEHIISLLSLEPAEDVSGGNRHWTALSFLLPGKCGAPAARSSRSITARALWDKISVYRLSRAAVSARLGWNLYKINPPDPPS